MVIPGPNAPKDMDSYLYPIVNELQTLEEGIPCFNGYTKQNFLLKAYLTHCTGDIPAISKCLNLAGHNAYKGCRFCNLLGIYSTVNRHIYFPLNKQCKNLVLRTHEETKHIINQLSLETNKSRKELIIKDTGIKGANLLFKLKGIEFPWSFPIDIMHLYFENVAPLMYLHWSGGFFKDNKHDDNSYNLTKKELEYIGNLMKESKKCLPLEIGQAPRDISKYHTGFKAVEWRNWIELFSVPLLKDIFIDK
ncbi:hypothetical protein RhiirB3_457106 [Rhizophagus irregularis]|nr:hypothetical protein RhiirB3_457106 [Rhizophagus irregularis]